jgi:hypothetical protein
LVCGNHGQFMSVCIVVNGCKWDKADEVAMTLQSMSLVTTFSKELPNSIMIPVPFFPLGL